MKKIYFLKNQKGMTVIELIIIVAIFSVVASTVVFDYGKFNSKVEIKNLANDIALKIVEAQKSALTGKLVSGATSGWTPAYGVLFNISVPNRFVYFADLDNSDSCTGSQCSPPFSVGGEVLEVVTITRGNTVPSGGLQLSGSGCPATISNISMVFTRPDSSPAFTSSPSLTCSPSNLLINVTSPVSVTGKIRLYSSGRLQMN